MDRLRLAILLPLATLGCPSTPKDGPPPAESFAVASAAPGALGALAGGTKGAPQALTPSGTPSTTDEDDAPAVPDDDDAPTPDAGAKNPENLPL